MYARSQHFVITLQKYNSICTVRTLATVRSYYIICETTNGATAKQQTTDHATPNYRLHYTTLQTKPCVNICINSNKKLT